jgi:two-component system nitrate/nitrite response regulator NarL
VIGAQTIAWCWTRHMILNLRRISRFRREFSSYCPKPSSKSLLIHSDVMTDELTASQMQLDVVSIGLSFLSRRTHKPIMNVARVFVVSAQEIFRTGVSAIACEEQGFKIVGDAPKLARAMKSIRELCPALIILDLQNCDLTQDLPLLVREDRIPAIKAIVITSASTDFELSQVIQAGVNGVICRNVGGSELKTGIREVLSGNNYHCSYTRARLSKDTAKTSLTRRELEVLQYLALGLSNKEIAKRLAVGVGTIKTHLININTKLRVTSRTEAVIRGVQQRLISI